MNSEDAVKPNITKLRSITVRTHSLHEMRRFYEALGISVVERDGVLDEDYLEMDLGGIAMTVRPESVFQPAQAGMDLVIAVDDPQGRMDSAMTILAPRERIGAIAAENVVLTDPDGRRLRLVASREATATHDR